MASIEFLRRADTNNMLVRVLVGLVAGLGIGLVLFFFDSAQTIEKVVFDNAELLVEIADDPREIEKGLGERESLPSNSGMLFILPAPIIPGFWMKDMKFPVDVIWIDSGKKVIHITEGLTPDTFPETFSPPLPVQYILEVNAGWAQAHGISVGDDVTIQ